MSDDHEQLWFQEARTFKFFFHRQIWHLVALIILVPITWSFAAPVMGNGTWMGVSDTTWFWLAVGLPILHQVITWVVFRLQLGWATLSRIFGRADLVVWGLLFLPFLLFRVITLVGLANVTQKTLLLPRPIAIPLAILLLLPALYTLYSVFRYFGLIRAMVGDHFRIRYRQMTLVEEGAYQFSNNAMYAFAFFLLWAIALLIGSQAALSVALFQHAYIWIHYFCTEQPDMDIIYSNND